MRHPLKFAADWCRRLTILRDLMRERTRQDRKFGEQNHPDGTGDPLDIASSDLARFACQAAAADGTLTWALIANEEVWEVRAERDAGRLYAECIQASAVYAAWAEAILRRSDSDRAAGRG